MDKKDWIYVIIAMIIVSVIVSIVSIKMANSDLSLGPIPTTGTSVYTKADIDKMLSQVPTYNEVKGSCQYINYKDSIYTQYNILNMSVMDICQKVLGGFVPKIITETESVSLYNHQNCSPSYGIYGDTSDNLITQLYPSF